MQCKGNYYNNYNYLLRSYDHATQLDPKYTDAWNNKGNAMDNLGRY